MSKIFSIIVFICMMGYIIYLHYVNSVYQKQISDSQTLINRFILKDSLASSIINIQESDSMFVLIRKVNKETGNILTYNDLDSICEMYYNQIQIQDKIILCAKKHYKFNYSYKIKGDSIFISFWNK